MANVSNPDEPAGNPPEPIRPSRPKRGAFPTPKSEIEKAKPYIPDVNEEEEYPEGSPDQLTDIEGEKEG
jgi:hypothetical protein